jgi:hypothetical protein
VNPAPGVFEWSWVEQVLEYAVRDRGLTLIIDHRHRRDSELTML